MKTRNKLVVLLMVALMAMSMIGCGAKYRVQLPDGTTASYNNLEELFNIPQMKETYDQMADSILSQYSSVYSDYETVFAGNTIEYKYYYVDGVDADAVKEEFEKMDLSGDINNVKASIERDSNIRPEKVTYSYYTADGELIYSYGE